MPAPYQVISMKRKFSGMAYVSYTSIYICVVIHIIPHCQAYQNMQNYFIFRHIFWAQYIMWQYLEQDPQHWYMLHVWNIRIHTHFWHFLKSLWLSDTIWWPRSGSTLAEVYVLLPYGTSITGIYPSAISQIVSNIWWQKLQFTLKFC